MLSRITTIANARGQYADVFIFDAIRLVDVATMGKSNHFLLGNLRAAA